MKRTVTELFRLKPFEDRYEYLKLGGSVGADTFGFDRYLNQRFYRSREWKSVRDRVIIRDNGCDLGIDDREIMDRIIIHHMNPMSAVDLEDHNPDVLNPEYLITTTHATHNAIHYGDRRLLVTLPPERRPNDTIPWR